MNDFERKLRQQAFRAPPPELRVAIFGRAEVPAKLIEPAHWTWRDWFWPSPLAWGALAALWMLFGALAMGGRATPAAPEAAESVPLSTSPTLLSYHTTRDLNDVLALAN
jgi:hypothetical protein